jgi:ectoine hydroxylase-related dioxygenase (phytanoyl-CoA dioxygenase family)
MNNLDFYNKNGYVVLKNAIPNSLIDSYEKIWLEHHSKNGMIINHQGWHESNSYLNHKEILDILCHENIFNFLNLLNPDLTLHLCFTSWTSTRKPWHQDYTFSDKKQADNYVGVWVALDKIDPNSGPFQFIPESHNWQIDFDKVYSNLVSAEPSEFLIEEINKKQASGLQFIGNKGDLIIWHGHTIHAGGIPENVLSLRKSLIGHYGIVGENSVNYGFGRFFDNFKAGTNLYN